MRAKFRTRNREHKYHFYVVVTKCFNLNYQIYKMVSF